MYFSREKLHCTYFFLIPALQCSVNGIDSLVDRYTNLHE
jgi:hypothetical protein